MSAHSFFHLTTARPVASDNLLDDLTPEEFDTVHAEAEPLVDVLLDAIHTYAQEHGLSMMAAWMAADVVRFSIGRSMREDEADA